MAKLEDPVGALVRTGDAKSNGIELPDLDEAGAVVDLLVAHPELMERPVLVKGDRAIIGRPTERVAPFLLAGLGERGGEAGVDRVAHRLQPVGLRPQIADRALGDGVGRDRASGGAWYS